MNNNNQNHPTLSYWEQNSFFHNIDVLIIGSGIVGLNAAITIKEHRPQWKVIILEKGVLPAGASTRNAGFACFGSMTELLQDKKQNGEEAMLQLVEKRYNGLQALIHRIGKENLDYRPYGGYELFTDEDTFQHCLLYQSQLNNLLHNISRIKDTFTIANEKIKTFGFANVKHLLFNKAEAQIDTGKMMKALISIAIHKGIEIYNGCMVLKIEEEGKSATALCHNNWRINARKILVCNNGFAKSLLPDLDVQAARNQVLITAPIPKLKIKGTFHYQAGYYYFRNVQNRILLGGARHLAPHEENTTSFDTTPKIKSALLNLLHQTILPNQNPPIQQWWSGILGIGNAKTPILKTVSPSISTALRLGGMGVAIGTLVGQEGANRLLHS